MTGDPVRAIADAVLYEGYILWPYRRRSLKNQQRFTFGGVYPPAHSARHPDDRSEMTTEVLLEVAARARVEITVRFLQVVQRNVARRDGGVLVPVDELTIDDERHVSWEEAREREITAPLDLHEMPAGRVIAIAIDRGSELEPVGAGAVLVREWSALRGELRVASAPVVDGVWRITVTVANRTPFHGETRRHALTRTFCSTHALLTAHDGAFVSLADPPPRLADLAAGCRNVGVWPVLVGDPHTRNQILSSPIILEDFPRVAPESPGDLFDGGEIDQLLILSILAMTDEEKAEMAACDPRAKEILERCEALTPEQLMALHGTIREFGMTR